MARTDQDHRSEFAEGCKALHDAKARWPVAARMTFSASASAAVELGDKTSLMHDEDSVAQGSELGQVGGHDENRHSLLDQLANQRVNLCLCADVDASGGLVENQALSAWSTATSRAPDFCWLPRWAIG